MKKLSFMGECMVELRSNQSSDTSLHQSFAGDVYNSAVYLKRCFSDVQVGFVTAVGNDTFSLSMKKNFEKEGLDTSLVFSNENRSAGLYLIDTDDSGERSFTYWRSQSAAKTIMSFLNPEVLGALSESDMFMFSGISIAIIPRDERPSFFRFIEALNYIDQNLDQDLNLDKLSTYAYCSKYQMKISVAHSRRDSTSSYFRFQRARVSLKFVKAPFLTPH